MPDGAQEPSARGEFRRRWRSRRFVVRDDSMRPAFQPGDRLYVDPSPGRPLAAGDVVVARDPERPGHLLLKRIAGTPDGAGGARPPPPAGYLDLVGDNAAASRDSRQFGPVPSSAVVGLAWFRYAPADRRAHL